MRLYLVAAGKGMPMSKSDKLKRGKMGNQLASPAPKSGDQTLYGQLCNRTVAQRGRPVSALEYKGYVGSVEFSAADECMHGKLLYIRDLVSYEAITAKGLVKSFRSAIDDYLETCTAEDKKPDTPFKGSLNVRLGTSLHRGAALAAQSEGVKINEFVKRAVSERLERHQS
jgi:predicted HicB family RNase H-like nuclease